MDGSPPGRAASCRPLSSRLTLVERMDSRAQALYRDPTSCDGPHKKPRTRGNLCASHDIERRRGGRCPFLNSMHETNPAIMRPFILISDECEPGVPAPGAVGEVLTRCDDNVGLAFRGTSSDPTSHATSGFSTGFARPCRVQPRIATTSSLTANRRRRGAPHERDARSAALPQRRRRRMESATSWTYTQKLPSVLSNDQRSVSDLNHDPDSSRLRGIA